MGSTEKGTEGGRAVIIGRKVDVYRWPWNGTLSRMTPPRKAVVRTNKLFKYNSTYVRVYTRKYQVDPTATTFVQMEVLEM